MSTKQKARYGVFPHAVWKVTNHVTGDGEVVLTGGGLVVRELTDWVPYSRMTPVKVYVHHKVAQAYADTHEEPSS